MISLYTGTIGSGKSYHALEDIVAALNKGRYVIANFPLKFPSGMIRRGQADRFMYVPDETLLGEKGVSVLLKLSETSGFQGREGACLVVIDEAGNHYQPDQATSPIQKLWKTFYTQSRKLGYDFILIAQDDMQINRTIRKCVEYEVKHRKANNVYPFKLLPFTVFMYVTYWAQTRTRLSASSSIFVKRFSELYNTMKLFAGLDRQISRIEVSQLPSFGNCKPAGDSDTKEGPRRGGSLGVAHLLRGKVRGKVNEGS